MLDNPVVHRLKRNGKFSGLAEIVGESVLFDQYFDSNVVRINSTTRSHSKIRSDDKEHSRIVGFFRKSHGKWTLKDQCDACTNRLSKAVNSGRCDVRA